MSDLYMFTAGPASDTYTVSTPWTVAGVDLAMGDLPAWMDRATLHGTMIMLLDSPALDGLKISPMDGVGEAITVGAVRAALDTWTASTGGSEPARSASARAGGWLGRGARRCPSRPSRPSLSPPPLNPRPAPGGSMH